MAKDEYADKGEVMSISREIIEQVRDACDIVDVISSYIVIKKRGKNYIGLCPFHSEKTGSFSINRKMQYFKCFGCGESGDVFTFVEKIEHISFRNAIEILANKSNINLTSSELVGHNNAYDSIRKINREALFYFNQNLKNTEGREAYEYLVNCGLLQNSIEDFGLGFSGKTQDGLYKYLNNKGFSNKELINSGLFSKHENILHDRFQNRIIIPVMDYMGKVIAFSGCKIENAKCFSTDIITKETKIYKDYNSIFGIHLARKTKFPFFILTDSYMGVMMLHQVGFDNAVACLGNNFSIEKFRNIKRYTNDIVISIEEYDAGKSKILNIIPKLINVGLKVKIMDIYPYKSPDGLIIYAGVDEFRKRLDEVISSFDYFKRHLSKSYILEKRDDYVDIMEEITGVISKMKDPFARNNYIKAIANTYNLNEEMLKSKVTK